MGVFATEFIPAGTITWALCALDQTISPARFDALPELSREYLRKYTYVDAVGDRVLCGDNARFINHHCEATCLLVGARLEIAVRDIRAGEELTDEYGALNIEEPFECACGSRECRGQIHPTDVLRYGSLWDAKVASVLPLLAAVPQPLLGVVQGDPEIDELLTGRRRPNVRTQYWAGLGASTAP
ncbi:MAG TPA: SET domain-containing protein [Polyangiaceae bacterium]|nr:SET domain-containing protein [Polyangiaceae bacterium]